MTVTVALTDSCSKVKEAFSWMLNCLLLYGYLESLDYIGMIQQLSPNLTSFNDPCHSGL